ncbi:MAG: methyltransferase domain-containing protein, partial [Candidatus Omnitrophica bacterium]|nr:methyltransferase domain-containing protein [Candidatus Omnitrophota bacterium]
YHKFFLVNIQEGAKVLDVGCSRGELTIDIAKKSLSVTAYDISKESIEFAKKNNSRENINYFVGEATQDMPQEHFDVAVCSNILEHLSHPRDFLNKLTSISEKILVRVPNIDNNWISGLKKDLGMSYFFDTQHNREYTSTSIREELEESGWQVESIQISHELRVIGRKKIK